AEHDVGLFATGPAPALYISSRRSTGGPCARDGERGRRVARTGRPASRRRRLPVAVFLGAEHDVGLFATGPAPALYISSRRSTGGPCARSGARCRRVGGTGGPPAARTRPPAAGAPRPQP